MMSSMRIAYETTGSVSFMDRLERLAFNALVIALNDCPYVCPHDCPYDRPDDCPDDCPDAGPDARPHDCPDACPNDLRAARGAVGRRDRQRVPPLLQPARGE
eukprot:4099755-Prymnesium_polylepis.1